MDQTANPGLPYGEAGREMLKKMNSGRHAELSEWGLKYLKTKADSDIIEIGCGGGANIARLLKLCPSGSVTGVDYADLSVKVSSETNREDIEAGKVSVLKENVMSLSFGDGSFDTATAFETIYFWPDIKKAFSEVHRVLKKDGVFFICNETDGEAPEGYEWEKENDNLKIYKIEQITDILKEAGFSKINVRRNRENGWVCFSAYKTAEAAEA